MLRTTDAHNFTYVKLAQEQIYGKPKINIKIKAFRFVLSILGDPIWLLYIKKLSKNKALLLLNALSSPKKY